MGFTPEPARPISRMSVIRIAWRLLKGYRLRPWRSPYLKWRIETWSGIEAAGITPVVFFRFSWQHRADLLRYFRWAGANSQSASGNRSRSW